MVKNLPAVQEMRVQSLGWEYPLAKGMATHSSILAWTIPMDREAWIRALVFVAACGLFLLVLSKELLFVVATCLLIVTAALVAELRL